MNRREFLWRSGGGLAGIALSRLLARDELLAELRGKKRVITGDLKEWTLAL